METREQNTVLREIRTYFRVEDVQKSVQDMRGKSELEKFKKVVIHQEVDIKENLSQKRKQSTEQDVLS